MRLVECSPEPPFLKECLLPTHGLFYQPVASLGQRGLFNVHATPSAAKVYVPTKRYMLH